jgi:ribosome-binding protein aMBF1 (putative translation factor)
MVIKSRAVDRRSVDVAASKDEWPSRLHRASAAYRRTVSALGKRIRQLREARSWTLEQAAEATNLDPTQLAKIEAGRINVTLVTLVRLAQGFGVEVAGLF